MRKDIGRLLAGYVVVSLAGSVAAQVTPQATDSAARTRAAENYLRLPLAFERQGTGTAENFVARGQGYSIGLRNGGATIDFGPKVRGSNHGVSLGFSGSRHMKAIAGPELPGKVNYIEGNDPRKWQTDLPTFGRVTYPEVYPGIDVVYYGNRRKLEFDLVVKPGADTSAIRMTVDGGDLSVDASGALKIDSGDGPLLRIDLPAIYQQIDGKKKAIRGHYEIRERNEVVFTVDAYDHTKALVIDPTIVYSTLFGGGLSYTGAYGIALDSSGNILIAGYTYAADFPLVNAAQSTEDGQAEGFVTKINAAGTALIYSTYLGGSSYQQLDGIAVDSTGSAWVTGFTESSDFPVLNAAQSTFGGVGDAVVARLSSTGALQFSTFLGGISYDSAYGIAVDSSDNGYVTGFTEGSFPVTAGTIPAFQSFKAFVTKYNPTGTIIYSTLLGGNSSDSGEAIAVDSAGNAYVTGYSYSGSFTGAPAGGAQTTNNGNKDAFVAKVNSTATGLLYFTFLGGSGNDGGTAIALDSSLNAYIAGNTTSTGLATAGAAQTTLGGATNGFAARLNSAGTSFTYVTYLGGSRVDDLTGLALDGSGNVYLTGYTDSANFPTASPLESTLPGNGISLFNSANAGGSWSAFDSNIPGAVFDASLNPSGSSEVVLTESGIYRTTNGGNSWTQQFGGSGSSYGSYLSRSSVAPGTIYATLCCSSVYRSTDDGVTWTSMGNAPGEPAGLLADPLTANTVYLFSYTSPYVSISTNAGATWSSAATGLPGTQVESMVATSDGFLYAGTNGSGIYKSTNQGATWTAVNTGLPANSSVYYPHALSASGTTVYFADGTIYATTNGGASWAPTPAYVGAGQVAASPQNASILYAFTYNNTVQESTNGGTTWNSAGTAFPSGVGYYNSELIVDPGNSAHVQVVAQVNEAAFVAKLNSAGSALTWSTYLGGPDYTEAYSVATDGAGNAYVTGYAAGEFPVTSTALASGTYGAFIAKISDATTADCPVTVLPGNQVVSGYGTYTFGVVVPSGCAWTASTNQTWASITSGASGSGVGAITVQLAYNSGATQTATLTVAVAGSLGSASILITQASGTCNFSLDQSSYSVASTGGTVSPVLTATTGCPWAVTNNYSGAISITSGASGTGAGTIGMTVSPNPSTSARTFYLSVGTTQIQIVQAASITTAPAISLLSPFSATAGGPAFTLTVYGQSFVTGSTVEWGATALATTYVSAMQLTAAVSIAEIASVGTVNVTVVNPGSAASNSATFSILASTGQTWTQLPTSGGPPSARSGANAVFDPTTTQMIVFGGGGFNNDTWSLNTTTNQWAQLVPAGTVPPAREGSTAVYDRVNSVMTVFGGEESSGSVNDVWTLSKANSMAGTPTWTQLNPTGTPPAPRVGQAAVYDPTSNRMIVFGGFNGSFASPVLYNDVWILSNANGSGGAPLWTQAATSGTPPAARNASSAVYDPTSNELIIFGGNSAAGGALNDVWILSNANGSGGAPAWTEVTAAGGTIPPRAGHTAVYDSVTNRMTVFGCGCFSNDTWVLSNANNIAGTPTWTELAPLGTLPPGREEQTAILDPTTNRMIVFGGLNGSAPGVQLNDTWALSDANGVASLTLTSSLNPSNFSQLVTLAAIVSPSPASGTVTFMDGSTVLGTSALTAGTATLGLTNLSAGSHSLTAVYSAIASPVLTQVVNPASASQITCSSQTLGTPTIGIRAEGITDQLPGFNISGCTGSIDSVSHVMIVNVTSNTVIANVSINGAGTDAVAVATGFTSGGIPSTVTGAYIGASNTLQFAIPVTPGVPPASGASIVIQNIRVNASALPVGTQMTFTSAGTNGIVTPGFLSMAAAVSETSLTVPVFTGYGNIALCTTKPTDVNAVGIVKIGDAFVGGFTTDAQEFALETASGASSIAGNPVTAATTVGSRIAVTFGNLVNGVSYYLPTIVTNGNLKLILVSSPASVCSGSSCPAAVTGVTIGGAGNSGNTGAGAAISGAFQFTPANGTFTAYYAVANDSNGSAIDSTGSGLVLYEVVPNTSVTALYTAPTVTAYLTGNTTGYARFAIPSSLTYVAAANPSGTSNSQGILSGCTSASGPYLISTIAGGQLTPVTLPGTSVELPGVNGVAVDSAGNTYFAEQYQHLVYKLDASGNLTRLAGTGICRFSGDGGPATNAGLCYPKGVAVDTLGNVYIADTSNSRIREVATNGTITTVAGNGSFGFSGDGGSATSAGLFFPDSVAVDGAGNIYIGDTVDYRIRKVSGGIITTVAGTGTSGYSGDGGAAVSAEISYIGGIAADSSGNLYIADSNNSRIRKVSGGIITTVAGNGTFGNSGDGGVATSAALASPAGVAVDSSGNLYIADTDDERIRVVSTTTGIITTIVGNGGYGFAGDGGPATSANLASPEGIAVMASGALVVADTGNYRIRNVVAGTINTVAGGGLPGDGGPVPFASLSQPGGIAKDGSGNLYIADTFANRVRKVTPAGVVSTIAGTGSSGFAGDGGPATGAMLNQPTAVALDASGNVYIADSENHRVRMVSGGTITTVAGSGCCTSSGDGGPATSAAIGYPYGIAVDQTGNLYIADTTNARIRKVSGGTITTVAGNGTNGYSGDGGAATNAELNFPEGITTDNAGNLYIADTDNLRVRKVSGGIISTVAGDGSCCFSGDGGPANSAEIGEPNGVIVNAAGNLYITDLTASRVREVNASGTIQTIAGNGGSGISGDGGPALSGSLNPGGLVADGAGNIYIADTGNNAIRLLTPEGTRPVLTIASAHTGSFSSGGSGSYSLTVTNAALAGSTNGTVTVTELPPSSLTISSMSGTGWSCTSNSCTRGDPLASGSSYPAITVSVNVSGTAPAQITNQFYVSGGGSASCGAEDFTLISIPAAAITTVTPNNAYTGSAAVPVTVSGTGIAGGSNLTFSLGSTTTVIAANVQSAMLMATIPAALLTTAGTAQVGVESPSGALSNTLPFTISVAPTPSITSINPNSVTAGTSSGTPVAVSGSNLTAGSTLLWSLGATNTSLATTLQSAQLLATIPAALLTTPGTAAVSIRNVSGIASNQLAFTITIPVGCTYSLSPGGAAFASTGGTGSITITAPAGCPWTATGNPSWITYTSPASGSGNGTLSYSVAATGGAPQVATLTIGGQLFTVRIGTYLISTIAGGRLPAVSLSGTSAAFSANVSSVATDSAGNTYFSMPSLNVVFRLDSSGNLTRFAGTGVAAFSGDGGPAVSAQINGPQGLAIDTLGNVYIADTNNNRIREITVAGAITTIAGGGTSILAGGGQPATGASLSQPVSIAADSQGELYFAEGSKFQVWKISGGVITTVAGNGTSGYAGDGGPATSAEISFIQGIAVDSADDLFIADLDNDRIRKVDSSGTIATYAGTGAGGFSGDGGPATSADISGPAGLAVDASGNLYIADLFGYRVREVLAATGVIATVAGDGTYGFSGDGGPATSASVGPNSVAVDNSGNLLLSDGDRIRKVTMGTIDTVVGGFSEGDGGPAPFAIFSFQQLLPLFSFAQNGIARDTSGNLYIADTNLNRVRKITSAGVVSTVAGTGIPGFSGDAGPATSAQLNTPTGIALDGSGNLYISDARNSRVREVLLNGTIATIAGNGVFGSSGDGGPANSAELRYPEGLAVDARGNIYIADSETNRVREVSGGTITTIAGNGTQGFSGDGGAATSAELNGPYGVAFDNAGNLYIADTGNGRIREVSNGAITTIAGNGGFLYSGDGGPATSAQVSAPEGLAVDSSGNIYIADTGNCMIREVDSGGIINSIAGTGGTCLPGAGGAALSTNLDPTGLALDTAGNIYLPDNENNVIRVLTPETVSPVLMVTSTHTGSFNAGGTGTYTVTVTNAAGAESVALSGISQEAITETLPPSLTMVSGTGTNWNCTGATCVYGLPLAAGASSSPLTVTVNVSSTAPAQVTNQVYVSNAAAGGVYSSGAEDFTLISIPAAAITSVTPNSASTGAAATPVTVSGSGIANGSNLSFSLGGNTTVIPANVQSAASLLATIPAALLTTPGTAQVGVLSPSGALSNTVAFTVTSGVPVLNITSSHTGNFTQGQQGALYTISVSNTGTAATSGTVTVTDTLPAGLTAIAISGTGWNCTLSALSCTRPDALAVSASYPAVTLTVNVASNAGSPVTNMASVSGGGSIAGNASDSTVIGAAILPTAASPGAGSALSQTFTFTFNDPNGYADLAVVDVLINNFLNGIGACYVAFAPASATSGYLYMVDDAGDGGYANGSPILVPSGSTLQNSQCTINAAGSSVSGSGNTLTLTLNVTFASGFNGNKIFYTAARSNTQNSGWQALGTWNVPGPPPSGPAAGSVSPARSTTMGQVYSFTFTDTNGYGDLAVVDILANNFLNGIGACYVAFAPSGATSGYLYLVDDAGDGGYASGSPIAVPSSSTLHNSQCTLNAAGSSVSASGNTLTLNLDITFSPGFAGNQVFYLAARNGSTGNSGWQSVGSVTVP